MGICCVPQELKQGLCDRLKGVVGREITGKSRREGTKNRQKPRRMLCREVQENKVQLNEEVVS